MGYLDEMKLREERTKWKERFLYLTGFLWIEDEITEKFNLPMAKNMDEYVDNLIKAIDDKIYGVK